jgi:hypothetical protein
MIFPFIPGMVSDPWRWPDYEGARDMLEMKNADILYSHTLYRAPHSRQKPSASGTPKAMSGKMAHLSMASTAFEVHFTVAIEDFNTDYHEFSFRKPRRMLHREVEYA